ncbi:protein DOWNY MILDEW RESISTANCE 6-like [Impatiens glandulifera]|uniref:protein DOWNY MILDEW RESISTANCE 6-like n=1 Tax=Impatiens glandulifera TaxID=253017 RepID=UPI001FB1655B|nr:protein DOWNY MILDEW RESISTANCE 6-like [Impatiens glandulifera]
MISNWSKVESVPKSYIFPPGERPDDNLIAPSCDHSIPIIDLQFLSSQRTEIINQILKASQDYGFFQLINHGVSEDLTTDMMLVAEEFFALPMEDKAELYSDDQTKLCRMKMSIDYANEKVHYWRENFQQPCYPLQDHINDWPTNPPRYREVARKYVVEVRQTLLLILDLICEGLGLENEYMKELVSLEQLMILNHYPKCPDPRLVLGLPKHCDPHILTLLNQGQIPGLQVYKDQQWFSIPPIPNAFVVNIGYIFEIISNGKLKSGVHRVVTNSDKARTTIANFIFPSLEDHIEPSKKLLDTSNTAHLFKKFVFKEFYISYLTDVREGKDPLQHYRVRD